MATWLKRITGVVGIVVVLLIATVVALPFIIDPNDYKAEIETLAAKQGVHLRLRGPITWRFFPTLGLSVNDVSVAPVADTEQTLARVEELTAAVAVMPLFKKQIRVNEVRAAGANIHLIVNPQGQGNWEALTQSGGADRSTPATSESPATTKLDLNIASIQLNNAKLVYDDQATSQQTTVRDFNLALEDVNTEERAFPLRLDLVAEHAALASPLRVTLTGQLAVNNALNVFALKDGTLRLPDARFAATIDTTANLENEAHFDGGLRANIDELTAVFDVLGIDKPVTADPAVMTSMAFNTTFQGDSEQINLPALSLKVDDTTLKGDAVIKLATDQNNLALTLNLRGDTLNADRYLPPSAETTAPNAPVAPATDSPLPLEALRATDAALTFQFDEIIINKMPISQLDMAVNGNRGLWQLQKLNATYYQGKLATTGQLDARGSPAIANIDANLMRVALQPLLVDIAEVDVLRGDVSANVKASTQAASTQQLMANLIVTVTFNGDSMVVDGINVEQKYCEMVAQVDGETETSTDDDAPSEPITWPQETTINEMSGRITMKNSVLVLEQAQAQVAYLLLGAKGKLDLNQQDYEISLPLTLTKNQTSENGCLVASDFLLNREINVLGCSGNLENLAPAKQCGLRAGAISDLAKQALRYNANKQIEKKVAPKVEEKKEELDEKKDEAKEKVRDRLKDLLNR